MNFDLNFFLWMMSSLKSTYEQNLRIFRILELFFLNFPIFRLFSDAFIFNKIWINSSSTRKILKFCSYVDFIELIIHKKNSD
jgi:hypothetical protein